jgi:hypothetical protein
MVAASIHKAQIPPDDAWAEAVFLAVSDKVFANEGFEWRESGELIMDVSWVFAGGVTNHSSKPFHLPVMLRLILSITRCWKSGGSDRSASCCPI